MDLSQTGNGISERHGCVAWQRRAARRGRSNVKARHGLHRKGVCHSVLGWEWHFVPERILQLKHRSGSGTYG